MFVWSNSPSSRDIQRILYLQVIYNFIYIYNVFWSNTPLISLPPWILPLSLYYFFLPTSNALKKKRLESTDCCLYGKGVGPSPGALLYSERSNPWVKPSFPPTLAITIACQLGEDYHAPFFIHAPILSAFILYIPCACSCNCSEFLWAMPCHVWYTNTASLQIVTIFDFYSISGMILEPWWWAMIRPIWN